MTLLYPYLLTLFYRPPPSVYCCYLLCLLVSSLLNPRVPPLWPRFHTPFASASACRDRGGAVVDPPSRGLDVSKLCDVCALYHLLGLKQIIGFSVFSLGLYARCEKCVIRVRKGVCLWRRPAVSVKSAFASLLRRRLRRGNLSSRSLLTRPCINRTLTLFRLS